MERPEGIKKNLPSAYKNKRIGNAERLIIIFHLVGIIGLATPFLRPVFLLLVPYHLLLMMVILLLNYDQPDKKLYFFLLLIFITGFLIEWTGVHTGRIFGRYAYGNVLGVKVDDVPLIIGVNWFLLIYATGVSLQQSNIKNQLVRLVTGAFVLVVLDVLIEPIAVRFDYWHWIGGHIPAKNYVCWFIVSMVLLFVFEQFNFKKQGMAALVLLISQFIFFAVLQ